MPTLSDPNILLIMTDQHRADHTGFGGNKIVRTPHLDSIARRGVVFDKAYVANPICMPNRSSILTSVVPSAHGVRYNGNALDPSFETFVRVLRDKGYATSLVGKSHLQNMNDGPEIPGLLLKDAPTRNLWRETAEDGWDRYEVEQTHREGMVELPVDFYGFEDVALTTSHSDYCAGHYYQWLVNKGVDPKSMQGLEHAAPYAGNWQQVWKTSVPEDLYPTRYVAEQTVKRIEQSAHSDKPFMIQCSFPDPHHPFTPPGKYFGMYDPADIPIPDTFDQDHSKSPRAFQHMISQRGKQGFKMAPFAPTADQFRDMAAKEYGMITMIDDAVGDILRSLESTGQLDNTVIVFTADHGDVFGDHGLMLKSTMHYDGVVRVPYIMAGPGVSKGRTDSLVSSLDIGPTLIDLIGGEPLFGSQGKSLSVLLKDPKQTVRDAIYIEEEQMFPDQETGRSINLRSVITANARLTVRSHRPLLGELYALDVDPNEENNIFDELSARDLRDDMMDRLVELMMLHSTPLRRPWAMA